MASKLPGDHLPQLPRVLEFFLPVKTTLHIYTTQELEISFVFSTVSNRFHDLRRTVCATVSHSHTWTLHVGAIRALLPSLLRFDLLPLRPLVDFWKLEDRFHLPYSICWKWNFQISNSSFIIFSTILLFYHNIKIKRIGKKEKNPTLLHGLFIAWPSRPKPHYTDPR